MATGKASDFKIYNDQFFGGLIEQLAQNLSPLGSVGIRMRAKMIKGDYELQSLIKKLSGIISRRDTTSVAAATDLAVTMDESISVKLNRKIGPVAQTLDAWKKAALPFEADWDASGMKGFSRYLGSMIAGDVQADMLNNALVACRVFLENANSGSNLHTIAANGTMTTAALVTGLSKMGDQANRVKAWVMHSKVYFDTLNYQINPANNGSDQAFQAIQLASPATLNRPVYVTDSSSLLVAGTPDLYRTIGLVDGGIDLTNSEEQTVITDLVTGLENIVARLQGEFAYNLGIMGAKWDITNGGANPSSGTLSTATNWDQYCTSMKDSAGVVIVSG
jgi:arsenate reductase-like glutaredoxin family protein